MSWYIVCWMERVSGHCGHASGVRAHGMGLSESSACRTGTSQNAGSQWQSLRMVLCNSMNIHARNDSMNIHAHNDSMNIYAHSDSMNIRAHVCVSSFHCQLTSMSMGVLLSWRGGSVSPCTGVHTISTCSARLPRQSTPGLNRG